MINADPTKSSALFEDYVLPLKRLLQIR